MKSKLLTTIIEKALAGYDINFSGDFDKDIIRVRVQNSEEFRVNRKKGELKIRISEIERLKVPEEEAVIHAINEITYELEK